MGQDGPAAHEAGQASCYHQNPQAILKPLTRCHVYHIPPTQDKCTVGEANGSTLLLETTIVIERAAVRQGRVGQGADEAVAAEAIAQPDAAVVADLDDAGLLKLG